MVVIRLARTGSKKNPFYHVVVADKRNPRDGRYIENIGYFNPMARGKAVRLTLQQERIEYWIGNGAVPSERVNHLIKEFKQQGEGETTTRPTKAELRQAQSKASKETAKKKLEAEKKAAAEAEKSEAENTEKEKKTEETSE